MVKKKKILMIIKSPINYPVPRKNLRKKINNQFSTNLKKI